ncbi:MAG: 16S rRNA (cytosine(1402)-N(4))-methyltransferase RsmH [Chitinophagales bacterium]
MRNLKKTKTIETPSIYHETVLLQEAVEALAIQPDGLYVDVTFGGGGHAKQILNELGQDGKLFGFDQDEDAAANLIADERLTFIAQNFGHIKRFLRLHGIRKVHGILADLGVSWHQFNTPDRGFSIRFDETMLDMRMSQTSELTAAKVLNTYNSKALFELLKYYGELPNARRVAQTIVQARSVSPIQTVQQLKMVVQPFVRGNANKFYAQLFQAIRIEVNQEIEVLKELLTQAKDLLVPSGRLVIITYHSIEDRVVKNFLKKGSFDGTEDKDLYGRSYKPFKPINKKVITPTREEVKRNPKSRSAKMRIAERLEEKQNIT